MDANIDIMASVELEQSLGSCGVFGVLRCYDTLMEGKKWATMRWSVFGRHKNDYIRRYSFCFPTLARSPDSFRLPKVLFDGSLAVVSF